MFTMLRTNTCNDLNEGYVGKEVTLTGWVHRRRDHGGIVFIDLRDRYGLTQVVSDPENFAATHEVMVNVRSEYVLQVTGVVRLRPEGQANEKFPSGKIELFLL